MLTVKTADIPSKYSRERFSSNRWNSVVFARNLVCGYSSYAAIIKHYIAWETPRSNLEISVLGRILVTYASGLRKSL